jgi:hypothetical protein
MKRLMLGAAFTLMNARAQLITAAVLSSTLLASPAAALDPEKQPIYVNIELGGPIPSLCGTSNGVCTVPPGQRLIIEYVSGFTFIRNTDLTTTGVSLQVNDPQLGLNGGSAFHTFVATKVATTSGPNGVDTTFAFSTPFKMMLHPGATFQFSPANAVAVSGYLVKE